MLEQGLHSKLAGTAGITNLTSTRIYPGIASQNTVLPYITYSRISGLRVQIMGSISGMGHPRMQISCWAATYTGVKALAEQVRLALDSSSGAWGGTTISASIFEGDGDLPEQIAPGGGKPKAYGVYLDFEIWHQEPTS